MVLDPRHDPLGQAALAYVRGDRQATIAVRSDLALDDILPADYLFRPLKGMPAWERQALQACRGRVADIGAGVGSHALALQAQGLPVTALDISPGAVEVMQARGVLEARLQSVWDWEPGPVYDTLLLMMNGIGLVGDLRGLNRFLERAQAWLAPGGQILLDSSDIRYLYDEADVTLPLPTDRYYGIVRYQMSFKQYVGEPFDWLYVDRVRLHKHATHFGYRMEVLETGGHYEYLARLRRA
ncbi:MAG: class I SAM-dependent methyltransferase [Bacteroidetes bacterium]|nr:MAG: class I SAM-dependent methyltransferase [Bacteroidota bacterium]